jgi:hypothetical protein
VSRKPNSLVAVRAYIVVFHVPVIMAGPECASGCTSPREPNHLASGQCAQHIGVGRLLALRAAPNTGAVI